MDEPKAKPVNTPAVSSRTEAWAAWEAAQLAKYKYEARPKNNFWRRFDKIRGHLFILDEIKQYTGTIVYTDYSGKQHILNILEGKEKDLPPYRLSSYGARFKPDYPELEKARQFIMEHDKIFRPHGWLQGDLLTLILRLNNDPDLADLRIVDPSTELLDPTCDVWTTGYADWPLSSVSGIDYYRSRPYGKLVYASGILADSFRALDEALELRDILND